MLRPHSDSNGASLVLDRPFAQGERVRVRTDLPIANARDGDYVFRVARVPEHIRILTRGPLVERVPAGARRRPRSRPDLRPPVVTVEQRAPEASQDAILLGPKPKAQDAQSGPMILDGAGRLVYFRPLGGKVQATDVRVQRYRGQPVLTWWQGTSRQGIGRGELVVARPELPDRRARPRAATASAPTCTSSSSPRATRRCSSATPSSRCSSTGGAARSSTP